MTHLKQLTGDKGVQEILLTGGGVPKDLDHCRHALEEEGRMTPTLPPFI